MKNKWIVLLCAFCLLCGCSRVWLSPDRYDPAFSTADYAEYKGKSLLFVFYNRADNTTLGYYYSVDSQERYTSHPSVSSYFYKVFQTALRHSGIKLYDAMPSSKIIPELRWYLFGFSDREIVVEIDIRRDEEQLYRKRYTIKMPPPEKRDQEYLEQRAYAMIDKITVEILKDSNLKKCVASLQ